MVKNSASRRHGNVLVLRLIIILKMRRRYHQHAFCPALLLRLCQLLYPRFLLQPSLIHKLTLTVILVKRAVPRQKHNIFHIRAHKGNPHKEPSHLQTVLHLLINRRRLHSADIRKHIVVHKKSLGDSAVFVHKPVNIRDNLGTV